MTPEQILALARSAAPDGEFTIRNGAVDYYQDFECLGDESHDVAWDLMCDTSRMLEEAGLALTDWRGDNDSVAGKVIARPA